MANLSLTGQRTQVQNALPTFQAFQQAMENRRAVWDRLTPEQRLRWVRSSNGTLADAADPVLWLAIELKQFLDTFEIREDA
jgi:hypothetical protein